MLDNLVREIKEETNVDAVVDSWMESSSIAKEKAKLYLFFKCSVSGNAVPSVSEETPQVFWATLHEIDITEATPALVHFIESRELLAAGQLHI